MALIIALLLLLLISAVGLGMVYMSTTETSINTNYKDTQTAFFAMRAGLEEGRDRLRANSAFPIVLPTSMPPAAGSIVYITNPAAAPDAVTPQTWNTTYFDDEYCHESFVGGVTYRPSSTPCTAADVPVGFTTVASQSPNTATAGALKYKWVRITLKQNGTFPNALVDPTQSTAVGLASQVCWDGTLLQERVVKAMGAGFTTCADAKNAGFNVQPVYLLTSMAITPQGSRRVGQYEAGAYMTTPPVAGLAFAGPGATFNNAPNSNNFGINGYNSGSPANNTGVAPNNTYNSWTGPGGQNSCSQTTPQTVPAIAVGDATGVQPRTLGGFLSDCAYWLGPDGSWLHLSTGAIHGHFVGDLRNSSGMYWSSIATDDARRFRRWGTVGRTCRSIANMEHVGRSSRNVDHRFWIDAVAGTA